MNSSNAPTIIIGAGFAGLFTALHLTNQRYPHPVILIDRNERFCFKPLLYDYLSGEMESYQTHPLYAELLHGRGITFIRGTVIFVDLDAHQVKLSDGTVKEYGNLVLTPGSAPAFFAEGAADHTLTFQNKADADGLKQHLMAQLEAAAAFSSIDERQRLLTVAIVGGGPVGVELALTLGDLVPQWYQADKPEEIRIVLLNRGEILSGDVNSRLRDTAMQAMKNRTVPPELILGAAVTAVRPGAVEFTRDNSTTTLVAGTIVWTAGTQVHPLIQSLSIPANQRAKRGQLLVKPTLQLLAHANVFAAGDCAMVQTDGPALPATAQVAYQQGGTIAAVLRAKARQETLPTANVSFRGTMMKLGLGTSVANVFDRYEIVGPVGQTIRQVMYVGLMPTPSHNIRTAVDWIKDDVFQLHSSEYHDIDYTAGYTVEELTTLGTAVTLSAAVVSMTETNPLSDLLEVTALKQELAGATGKYPQNRLIHALFGHQAKRKLAMEQVNESRSESRSESRHGLGNPVGDRLEQVTDRITQAIDLLAKKSTPEELADYKELLYSCCDRVARAAGRRPFQRISSQEASVLNAVKAALMIEV